MDSQENNLQEGTTQEEKKVEELENTVEPTEAPVETTATEEAVPQVENEETAEPEMTEAETVSPDKAPVAESEDENVPETDTHKEYKTKAEILERIKEIAHDEDNPQKDEVDYLKSTF